MPLCTPNSPDLCAGGGAALLNPARPGVVVSPVPWGIDESGMAGKGRVLGERGRARWFVPRALLVAALSASSALGADSDGDGLDDAWEQQYFNGLSAVAAADLVGDGLTN